jgi:putative PIN family toxin of toxin-antitoxin system
VIAVLDANVVISALVGRHGHAAFALNAAIDGHFVLCLSEYILGEIHRRVRTPRIASRIDLSPDEIDEYLRQVARIARLVVPDETIVGIVRDPQDDVILGTAVAGEADYLVTGDVDLLSLATFEAVRIVTPRQFTAILDDSG